jgi:hypothetical protein
LGRSADVVRRVARKAWRITRWPLLAIALIVTAMIAINAADERLSTQAQVLLRSPPNPYADADNLFVLLAGLDAPAEKSQLSAGQANIANYLRAATAHPPRWDATRVTIGHTPESERLKVTPEVPEWGTLDAPIWERARAATAGLPQWTSANRVLLDRYAGLLTAKEYYEDVPWGGVDLYYSVPRPLRVLYLANIARAVQSDNGSERLAALKSLEADTTTWRGMLRGEGNLISKMVATANLHADLMLLADMIEDRSVPLESLQSGAATLLVPWPPDACKIGKVFPSEFRRYSAVLAQIARDPESSQFGGDEWPNWLERRWNDFGRIFFKPRATLNLEAALMERLAATADADPAHYSEGARAYLDWCDHLPARTFPALLYNPLGKLVAGIDIESYLNYPLRAYDVAAYQRLVVLAYELRSHDVTKERVAAFMAAHPEVSTHPVDRTPFVWDAATGEIRVPNRVKTQPDRRFDVRIVARSTRSGAPP